MMNAHRVWRRWWLPLLGLIFPILAACRPASSPPTPTLVIPTSAAPAAGVTAAPLPTATAPPAPTPLPTVAATVLATSPPPTPTLAPSATPTPAIYRVAFVAEDDTLNVRAGPGVDSEVTAELAPATTGLTITGSGEVVEGSTWVPVSGSGARGWVNGRFLTEVVPAAAFCQDPAVTALLQELQTAVAEEDGATLAQLVHPERGLRIRHDWWNPEVFVNGGGRERLFSSAIEYSWGAEDGSGQPIEGAFAGVILPLLQADLLDPEGEVGCNEILSGATAGLVQLPPGYTGVNYLSVFRPPPDEIGFDWGTWVVGIERWRGRYFLSFLVHYDYEI